MLEKKENFVIVDANSFVHSAFHGYEPQYDLRGKDQRVLYGIMQSLVNLTFYIHDIKYIYVVFDPDDGSLYRKSLYPLYKANRPEMDQDLYRQKVEAKRVLEAHLGIPVLSYPGFEADDIIGSLALIAKEKYKVVIVSPDKDLAQLVNKDTILLRKVRTKLEKGYKSLNEGGVLNLFGVQPIQIPDWLALVGDTVDNLPGIDKVGGKTAAKLLSVYPSVEHMLSVLHEMPNLKLRKNIESNKEILKLVKKLATIVCDLPLEKYAYQSLERADRIRTHKEYNSKLITIKKHYQWPDHFIDILLND